MAPFGEPMDILYAPWRETYATDIATAPHGKETAVSDECVFCTIAAQPEHDTQNFVLKRYQYCFIILNRFPYNAGHLLVIPYAHIRDLPELNQSNQQELISLLSQATNKLQTALGCDGLNIGINMGKAAGAGIPAHLHAHVLPRWNGDTNFLPALAQTKAISFDLSSLYTKLIPYFQ